MTLTTIFSIGLRLVAFAVTGLLMQDGVWLTAAAAIPAGYLRSTSRRGFPRDLARDGDARAVGILLLASGRVAHRARASAEVFSFAMFSDVARRL